jgi:hypothetical protein
MNRYPCAYKAVFQPGILHNPQGYPVLAAQLLQLSHDTVGDVGDTLGVEAVHHTLDYVHLVLNGEVDKIGIHYSRGREALAGCCIGSKER